ncbi:hypothetical protein QE152_g34837 [Popillia japonica]|uniref:Uncharacterized protein n=1 Tax=Popillia japonica TaxID=7064 RepID=A0AAW1ISZ5_POPJA
MKLKDFGEEYEELLVLLFLNAVTSQRKEENLGHEGTGCPRTFYTSTVPQIRNSASQRKEENLGHEGTGCPRTFYTSTVPQIRNRPSSHDPRFNPARGCTGGSQLYVHSPTDSESSK